MSQFSRGRLVVKVRDEKAGARRCGRASSTSAVVDARWAESNSRHILDDRLRPEGAVKPPSNRGGGIIVAVCCYDPS